jgi:multiple sugar transport system ATP-binding protein
MNFVDVTITDNMTLKNHQFEIDTPAKIKDIIKNNDLKGKEVVVGIRPEDLEDAGFVPASKDSNTITADVEVTEPMGSEIYVYVDINGVLMTARVTPKSKLRSGDKAKLYVDLDMMHLFDKKTEKAYI